ncbi:hypothetical protein [Mesorhizobium sp.]|jgi:branched-chain amino acid transport system ATP-binding protein|uniref:hypothetical protein n=1 Tax=Mesorhizobium sp. TaxID=1871066 RepID=UPI000FE78CD6|nr:hypothetical protein [Mesorhizobium sp.]RWI13075.1 MAG: hypothetical protein EOQ92_31420 [Mesorhizobium sp.]RWK45853.1 MAG: hypothetical protein EOR47_28950 [Mesorhizobium sp.]RWK89452.1 MAG: hypothetical protein EOR45_28600 [Mesorhizobium sp.]RWK89787.1 MAG: hypothetical protein EOR53_31925 [Mesorhizobium sp.]TIP56390.1 MAG: hypothetical protein E5X56_24735 [Mesorhizobium sp.]
MKNAKIRIGVEFGPVVAGIIGHGNTGSAGVHPNIRKIILEAIARLREQGTSFFVIEHDMEMVRNVCDRIIVMDSGRVVTSGAFEDIVQNSEVMQTYLGRPQ